MRPEPGQILALLYAIKPDVISRDLKNAEERLPEIIASISKLSEVTLDERTAADEARIAHMMMVQAYALCRMQNTLPEFRVFYASFGAGNIMQRAEAVALNQGRLAELTRQMGEIRLREGLAGDEFWFGEKGPVDHQKLEAEVDALEDQIVDTVMISVLNRYRLHEQAKIYENDRKQWDLLREIGARVVISDGDDNTEAERLMDIHLAKKHGEGFVAEIHKRVSAIQELLKISMIRRS